MVLYHADDFPAYFRRSPPQTLRTGSAPHPQLLRPHPFGPVWHRLESTLTTDQKRTRGSDPALISGKQSGVPQVGPAWTRLEFAMKVNVGTLSSPKTRRKSPKQKDPP